MQFDCIVGNPPYNNGMDLDFINRGHDLSVGFNLMIVPAKWLYFNNNHRTVSESISNTELRSKLNKYIKTLVFYPEQTDVFNIDLVGGILYFLDDHIKHDECILINKSSKYKSFNNIGSTKLSGLYSLYNIINDFILVNGHYKKIDISNKNQRYIVATQSWLLPGGLNFGTMLFTPVYCLDQTSEMLRGLMTPLTSFESIPECESFFSFIDRPLIKLLISCCVVQYTSFIKDPNIFDLVPDPGIFDHLFTDDELYRKYNVPDVLKDDLHKMFRQRGKLIFGGGDDL